MLLRTLKIQQLILTHIFVDFGDPQIEVLHESSNSLGNISRGMGRSRKAREVPNFFYPTEVPYPSIDEGKVMFKSRIQLDGDQWVR